MKPLIAGLVVTLVVVSAPAQTPVLLRTFNNPTPAGGDIFGAGIAALGNDCLLIGAPFDDTSTTDAGIAYLFQTNGSLLTTFTNPNPASEYAFDVFSSQFGSAIAHFGADRVLIGSPQDRKVYLFATNGALLTTIDGPPNGDAYSFGTTVVAFGNDKVLVGEPRLWNDAEDYFETGRAYLYSTNGALLTTFNNPDVGVFMNFGISLAALGSDRVVVGASSFTESNPGAAYLFNTSGALLTTFTNPAPDNYDRFGHTIAVASPNWILVGETGDNTVATAAGAVHVFDTNGILLTTITNPTPAAYDYFGAGMALVGSGRVVIGASGDDATGTNAGSAYLFNVDGTLLATVNNPTPGPDDYFGGYLAACGNGGVIIGTPGDDTSGPDAGSAYLFKLPAPAIALLLTIWLASSNTVVVSWPSPSTGFVLQQNTNGVSSLNWSNVTDPIQDNGTNKSLLVSPTNASRFYRLVKP